MQVLNMPVSFPATQYEAQCEHCGAIVIFGTADILSTDVNMTSTIHTYLCPACNQLAHKTLNNRLTEKRIDIPEYNHVAY